MTASIAARTAIVIASAAAMEAVAWVVHRHLMHGVGWRWHRSHHQPPAGIWLERNDLYAVVFALLTTALMAASVGPLWPLFWVGLGMTVYGVLYAVVHDGLVHRRWPLRWTPRRGYLARLVQAHRLHHAVRERDGGVSFGFLYARPPARLAATLRQRRGALSEPAPGSARGSAAKTAAWPEAVSVDGARRRQTAIGLLLAAFVVGAWLLAQGCALFGIDWGNAGHWWLAPLLLALICWLDVGLFIVAHDAMHGSLAPTHRRLNRVIGRLCLALYAGFSLDRFVGGHFAHHREPGTADDPDFSPHAQRFWPWYACFMRRYFGWREAAGLAVVFGLLVGVLRAPLLNVMLFWALPAVLSSVQLFAFGTWLPHRTGSAPFADRHRARSNAYGWLASLLSCFHFGYHLEHHLRPDAPWWRLPAVRRARETERPR